VSANEPEHVVNRLIEGLPHEVRNRILKLCKPVELATGSILCEPNTRLRYIYFPLTTVLSLVAKLGNHAPLEIELIGNEGMLGATLVMGVSNARLRGIVRGSGTALRMTATKFRRELRSTPSLQRTLNRYLFVLLAQLSQTTACTRFHEIKARLARCLLMTHDRASADHFHLTHQQLADALGVRRSAITIAAGALQRRKLIRYTRGKISILDREGLEAASCECYEAVIEDHELIFA
jgi:CRP-like cAMP-binding protein